MSVLIRFNLILALLLSLLAAQPAATHVLAQPAEQQYFPETGHHVSGEFLRAYQAVKNPLLLYGYPITDEFQDETTGRKIQYFQRARFELHPNEPEELRVKLTPLGWFLYQSAAEMPLPENFPACQGFPETGKQVCYTFLEFFNEQGGVSQFGQPISNFEIDGGRIVQNFQKARFEWHPEYPPGQRVTLTNLGSLYFEVRGENPVRLMVAQDNHLPATVLGLRARAYPLKAVTTEKGTQTVYVVIQDQNLRPVANAQAVIIVRPPSGKTGRYILPLTDEHGIASLSFAFEALERGVAEIEVTATYSGLEQRTVTSFRVWW